MKYVIPTSSSRKHMTTYIILVLFLYTMGSHGGEVVEALCYKQKVAGLICDGVTGFFH
jgi:hypothetical protein